MIEVEIDKILAIENLKSDAEQIAKDIQNPLNPDNLYVFIGTDDKPVAAMINIDYLKQLTGKDKIAVKKVEESAPETPPAPAFEPIMSAPSTQVNPEPAVAPTPEVTPMPSAPMPIPEIPPIGPTPAPTVPTPSPSPAPAQPINPTFSATTGPASQPAQTPPNLDIPI